ncbi:hypothetical protein W03_18240 [Nitrosomonas sp. PY1]|nr:hypothetical protein W03_18240 [Nitrosomonas sp. PY1]
MKQIVALVAILWMTSIHAEADYFHRDSKIFGTVLTDSSQINEVIPHTNAFGFAPNTIDDITEYLNRNDSRLLPVISISHLLLNSETGLYRHNVNSIIQAIEKADIHNHEFLFLIDEPLWIIRSTCKEKNQPAACNEITNNYAKTLATFRKVGKLLRQRFPGSGIMHIESWAELAIQKQQRPHNHVIMLDDAEFLGFDCYGDIDSCGSHEYGYRNQIEYGTWVWDAMLALESRKPINRKLFLVPGSFLMDEGPNDIDRLLKQLGFYAWVLQASDKIGGFGTFLWGDMIENGKYFTGARNIRSVADFLANIAEYYNVKN